MQTIEIKKIKINKNIRSDYGDLTELTDSIKEHGVRQPVELDKENILVDGYRRVKAATKAGLNKIPYFKGSKQIDKTLSQMIAGIFSKNLNPIEEGNAFRGFMDKHGITAEDLAAQINKKIDYVKKRLLLIGLPEEVKQSLIDKKILLGHALLLAKLSDKDSKKYLREIISGKRSVEEAKEDLSYSEFSVRLSDACFDTKECKGCKYNGSEQTELFETGKILSGNCLNTDCYGKKRREFIKNYKEKNKDILITKEETPTGFKDPSYSYDLKELGMTNQYMDKCRKERTDYLVHINDRGNIREFIKIPGKKSKGKTKEVSLDTKRKEVLGNRIQDYKRTFLIDKSFDMLKPDTVEAKVLAIGSMVFNLDYTVTHRDIIKTTDLDKLLKSDHKDLDLSIANLAKIHLNRLGHKELIKISGFIGIDMKKHFVVTKEFLELHTKDQLIDLGKEFGLNNIDKAYNKKSEFVEAILLTSKNKVPKSVL